MVPCDGWTEAQVKAFLLMVNRSVNWAESDLDALANLRFNLRDLAPAALNHWLFPELNPSPNILVMADDSAPASARPGFR